MQHRMLVITCKYCGYPNCPDPFSGTGIEKLLAGKLTTCKNCSSKLTEFSIPTKPVAFRYGGRNVNNVKVRTYKSGYPHGKAW